MSEDLINKVMAEVMKKVAPEAASAPAAGTRPGVTEFVGTNALGDTIGLVIANVDPQLHEMMGLDKTYRSIGILGARTGAVCGLCLDAMGLGAGAQPGCLWCLAVAGAGRAGAGRGCVAASSCG